MTSTELYNLVRDVRRDAWPEHVQCVEPHFYRDALSLTPIHDHLLEPMFVGSMAARALELGMVIHKDHIIATGNPPVYVVSTKGTMAKAWTGDTLIEALAAALKEVDRV